MITALKLMIEVSSHVLREMTNNLGELVVIFIAKQISLSIDFVNFDANIGNCNYERKWSLFATSVGICT